MVRTPSALVKASLLLAMTLAMATAADRLGDFDGDGKADVLLRHADGNWRYHRMEGGSPVAGRRVAAPRALAWFWGGAGDFNGDGRDDLMLRRREGGWVYYPLDGSRVIAGERGRANLTRDPDWRVVGVADLNGDGRDDILMRRLDGAWSYFPMDGRRAMAAGRGKANLPRSLKWRMQGTGDFDGDGREEVLLRHVDGPWRYYRMDGRRVVAGKAHATRLPGNAAWRLAGIGDYDGDGRDDALLRHADGRWHIRTVERSAASVATSHSVGLDRDWNWRLIATGDGDGDGRDDVLLRHRDGHWRWYRMDGHRVVREVEVHLPRDDEWRLPARPVHIPDLALRGAIEYALGKDAGEPVRERELAALDQLHVYRHGISDLAGIEAATSVTFLDIRENQIASLAPLMGLAELRHLMMRDNRVGDLTPLAGLRQLEGLLVTDNEVSDVSALAGLTAMRLLSAADNQIVDISPLAGLTGMELLWLSGNAVEDIDALADMARLEYLKLDRNHVSDVSALRELTGLTDLYLSHNRIDDISPLAALVRLTVLDLDDNAVEDIAALANLTGLEELGLADNLVADLLPLSGLTSLTVLRLGGNRIEDISPLRGLGSLTTLTLHDNRVADVGPIADLVNLEALNLDGNRVVDAGALVNLTGLRHLHVADNLISDLRPLYDEADWKAGLVIDVRGNPLSAFSRDSVVPALFARGVVVQIRRPLGLARVYDDTVFVLRVGEDIATGTVYDGLRIEEYANTLYTHFEDAFDFVVFLSNLDAAEHHEDARYGGIYLPVRNEVAGIGRSMFYDNRFGSRSRLKGVIHFIHNQSLRYGVTLHEFQHAWSNYLVPTAAGGHWGFSSADGQHGGFDLGALSELGDDRYTAGAFHPTGRLGNDRPYSPLELYLAGYVPPEEVPDLWVAADGRWLGPGDGPVRAEDRYVFHARNVRTYSIEDIVREHGPRVPGAADAPWHFRVAVVLLTDAAHPALEGQLDRLSMQAAQFSRTADDGDDGFYNYFEATGGRGSIAMTGLSQFRKAQPQAVRDLPASFGVVPNARATLLDGRCLPLTREGTLVQRGAPVPSARPGPGLR